MTAQENKGGPLTEWIAAIESLLPKLKKYEKESEERTKMEPQLIRDWAMVKRKASDLRWPEPTEGPGHFPDPTAAETANRMQRGTTEPLLPMTGKTGE